MKIGKLMRSRRSRETPASNFSQSWECSNAPATGRSAPTSRASACRTEAIDTAGIFSSGDEVGQGAVALEMLYQLACRQGQVGWICLGDKQHQLASDEPLIDRIICSPLHLDPQCKDRHIGMGYDGRERPIHGAPFGEQTGLVPEGIRRRS
jgi:hypothetical protein